jgi:hypothetical protein
MDGLQAVEHARDSKEWSIEEEAASLASRVGRGSPALAGEQAERSGVRGGARLACGDAGGMGE